MASPKSAPAASAALAATVGTVAPEAPAAAYPFKYQLEDGIPLPSRKVAVKGETAYPYAVMGVNQSFFVPVSEHMTKPWQTLTSMSSRISRELHPKKFTTAKDTVDGVEGVRVWRVEDSTKPLEPPKTINRKTKAEKEAEAAALAKEAVEGDTSNKVQPEPMFEGAGAPPPPPPAPAA